MEEAHRIAVEKARHSAAKGRIQYNKKVRASELDQRDRVLVKNLLEKGGPGKLRSFWENTIYIAIDQKDPNSSVYTVKPLHMQGRQRVQHRNLLLPCPYLPYDVGTENEQCRSTPQVPCKVQRMQSSPPTESDQTPVNGEIDQEEYGSHHQFDPRQLDTAARLFSSVAKNNAEPINYEERVEIVQPEFDEMLLTPQAGPSTYGEQDASSKDDN